MQKVLLGFILILLGFCSCEQEEEKAIKSISLLQGEMDLNHGDLLLSNRAHNSRIVGKDSLLIYDGSTNQLLIYNLEKQTRVFNLSPETEGPDFFDFPLMDIEVENQLIYVLSRSYFSVFNFNGKIVHRWGVKDFPGLNSEYFMTSFEIISPKKVLFNKIPFQAVFGQKQEKTYQQNLFMTFNLSNETIIDINVRSPEEALLDNEELGYFQDFSFHSMTIDENKIVYSFPFSTKTYIYDLENDSYSVKKSTSNLVTNLRKPANISLLGTSKWINYTYTGPKFSQLSKDEVTGYYARVLAEFKTQSDGSSIYEKFLMILNEDLEVLTEIKINDKIWEPALFTNGIVYLHKTDQDTESALELITYKLLQDSDQK